MIDLTTLAAAKAYTDRQRLAYDESVTIEWDGDSTGKVTVGDGMATKVSDLTPEPSDLIGGTFTYTNGSQSATMTITEDMIQDNRGDGVPVVTVGYVVIAYAPSSDAGIPEAGIYFVTDVDTYASSLTYGSIKKLDPKYLPEGGVGYEGVTDMGDTLTWDGTPTDTVIEATGFQLHLISGNIPTVEELIGGAVTVMDNGVEREDVITFEGIEQYGQVIFVAELIAVVTNDGVTFDDVTFPKKGVYFLYTSVDGLVIYTKSLTIPNYNFTKTEVHKIDKKFLPESIHYYDSLSSVPADLPDGSFVAVPANDEVVDLSEVFDFATSIMQGGAVCTVEYDCTSIVEQFKKGAVNVRVKMGDFVGKRMTNASIIADSIAQIVDFSDSGSGQLLCLNTTINAISNQITYWCQQVSTAPYVPS
jgi:hypothetical protein